MKRSSETLLLEIINTVKPLLTQDRRRGLLKAAFVGECGEKVLNQIDFDGANDIFAPTLVRQLETYGEVEPGRLALTMLLESIAAGQGIDHRERFNDLITRVNNKYLSRPETGSEPISSITDGNAERIRIQPVSGRIFFSLREGKQKDRRGGRFVGEVTVRVRLVNASCPVEVVAIELSCINEKGIYASPLSQTIELLRDVDGRMTSHALATHEGQLLEELALLPRSSLILRVTTDFAARAKRFPYEWDFGYLRIRGIGYDEKELFDTTFLYKGARSITLSQPPSTPWFYDTQLQLLLEIGYMNSREVEIMRSISPDERMLLLWDSSYEIFLNPDARTVVDAVWERLHPEQDGEFFPKRQGPIFPPPFPSLFGKHREVTCVLSKGQHNITLPSQPVRPDCMWVTINGIPYEDSVVKNRDVQVAAGAEDDEVRVIYIEDESTDRTQEESEME